MSLKHLESDRIDHIALCLDEDVYGANGDLTDLEIRDRLIANIREETDVFEGSNINIHAVAAMLMGMWEYMDRGKNKLLAKAGEDYRPLPDTPAMPDHRHPERPVPRFSVYEGQ